MAKYCRVVFPLKSHHTFTYLTGTFADQIKSGQRLVVPFGRQQKIGFVAALSDEEPAFSGIKSVIRILDTELLISEKLLALAHWVADYYCASLGEVLRFIISVTLQPPRRESTEEEAFYQGILTTIAQMPATPAQKKILDELQQILLTQGGKVAVLEGVAASGKTEIYLQLAGFTAQNLNGQSLILVPEIVLVPQIEDWAKERFGNRVAVLHSRLSRRQHYQILSQAKNGEISVVIGTRSAVFVPFARLKLIVVDEEFDRSYKETRIPRYHAREVAIKRGEIEDALVVLGSATPSLEVYRAAREGRFHYFTLSERIGNMPFPRIHISDLRNHGIIRKRRSPLISNALRNLIEERLLRGEQAIIFVNRRGYSTYFFCEDCGYLFSCPNCSVSLVYHRTTGEFYCHYCNYRTELPSACPSCGKNNFGGKSFGTQAIEKQLKSFFPDTPVLRLDSDTMRKKKNLDLINRFREGKAGILVGTQLVTKGHHFPGVTLVGVLGSDSVLNLPDFRAAERSFQTLLQVAGRAGRNLPGAEVFIQTYYPDHYALVSLPEFRLESFYEKEMSFRKEVGYPPFGYLANIIFYGKREDTVIRKTQEWCSLIQNTAENCGIKVLGPSACFHKKIRGSYRWHIMLRAIQTGKIQEFLKSLPEKKLFESGVTIDIDPIDLF
ncbi:MAG: primosomal protein N' [Candidatus Omnitrophota bacterium]